MPRSIKLTWQSGRDGRAGRWRKKYRGKIYYFEGGRGKSDRSAYDAAIKQWELEKLKIDSSTPRPHEEDHAHEIEIWEQALAWSTRHGDSDMAQTAFDKCTRLRALLEAPILKPVAKDDRFQSQFELPIVALPDNLFEKTGQPVKAKDFKSFAGFSESTRKDRERIMKELDGSPLRIQQEIWNDRLSSQQKRAVISSNMVADHVLDYVKQKEREAAGGELSVGRIYAVRLHLHHFRDWMGTDSSVNEIDGQRLRDYHNHLLQMVENHTGRLPTTTEKKKDRVWTAKTAKEYLGTAKSFIRWLWEMEIIPTLPRVLGTQSKSLKITPATGAAVTFDDQEIQRLLKESTGRTKLYICLMLNCGMTQKDVADIQKSEVDFDAGRIIRKRSKTDKFKSVPTVNYLLWPETLRLLKEFADRGDGDLVLLNSNGSPLWAEGIDAQGKYFKSDNIKNSFDRLRKKLEITKPLKSLKKSSSSKLRDNEKFNGLEDLYLGHAPQKMSDKHYTTAPQKLFDTALTWLAEQYGLNAPKAE